MRFQEVFETMRQRFDNGLWDPNLCSKAHVEYLFHENGGFGVDFESFSTLYRRACCEELTTKWKTTRERERTAALGVDAPPPPLVANPVAGVFDCWCFELHAAFSHHCCFSCASQHVFVLS